MNLRISDTAMTSDQTAHTARHVQSRDGWEVSWLPGQILDRNTAVTAMVVAATVGDADLGEGHRLWPFIQSWAAELGLTGPDAVARAARPPGGPATGPAAPANRPTQRQASDPRQDPQHAAQQPGPPRPRPRRPNRATQALHDPGRPAAPGAPEPSPGIAPARQADNGPALPAPRPGRAARRPGWRIPSMTRRGRGSWAKY